MSDGEKKEKKKKKVQKFRTGPIEGMRLSDIANPHHRSLDDPRWVATGQDAYMRPDDFVLGVTFEGQAYALPWFVMKNHHMVNMTIAAVPYLVCLCEACSTGCAFSPVIDGRRLHFDLAGDYNGTFVIMDRETQTIWQPFMGEALTGELAGRRLDPLPLIQCTWAEWTAMHPHGLVLSGEGENREGHGSGMAPGTFENNNFYRSALHLDDRLPPSEMVLGVRAGGASRAYPLSTLWRHPSALPDELGGVPIVIFSRPQTMIAVAYSPQLEGKSYSFDCRGDQIVDLETGSTWSIFGKALSGLLEGTSLPFIQSYIEEWYAWATSHRDTGLWSPYAPATEV